MAEQPQQAGLRMGGFISVLICVVGVCCFYGSGHPLLFGLSALTALVSFWSCGVMHNHTIRSAKQRHGLMVEMMRAEGRSEDEIRTFDSRVINPDIIDTTVIPDWVTVINILATLTGIVLLAWGAVVRI